MTFSGRIVDEIRARGDGFFSLAMGYSQSHAEYFKQNPLTDAEQQCFIEAATDSHLKQQEMEQQLLFLHVRL